MPVNVMNTINFKVLIIIAFFAFSQPLSANAAGSAYSSMPAVDCVINPFRVVDISSPVPGVIEKLYVERSQQVSVGQVVAQLGASVERANVELARYRAGIDSEIGLSTVNIKFDQLRKKRVEGLLEAQNISRENADQIEREVQLSQWKLKQARELADIRQLELRKAEQQLRQKSILAPFDGFVLDTFKNRGEYIEDQAILRLAQLDPLVIEAIVPMENFGLIIPGMQAEVIPEFLLSEKLKGEVIAVDRIGDTASNTFGVKLSIPNPENRIPAGLKCIVKFLEMTPDQVAEETDNQANSETPKALIQRPAETDIADKVVSNDNTIVDRSVLLAAISTENITQTTSKDPIGANGQSDKTTAQQVAMTLDQGLFDLSGKMPSSYMVLIQQPETKTATRDLVNRLRHAGVIDFLVFDSGANKGHISLGVYNKWVFAENRRQVLDQLGFSSFTIERYQ